jgi:hypothetical protein
MARQLQRQFQGFGTVVNPGKEMAVKINHTGLDEYPLL